MISVTAKLKTYSVLLSVLSVLSVITIVQAVSATSVTTLFSPLPVYLIPDEITLNIGLAFPGDLWGILPSITQFSRRPSKQS